MWHWLAARRVCSVWLACEEKWLWKGFKSESKLYPAGKGCVRSLCQRKQSQSACLVQNNSIKFHIRLWNKHSLSNMAPNLEEVFHIKDLHRTLQFIPHFYESASLTHLNHKSVFECFTKILHMKRKSQQHSATLIGLQCSLMKARAEHRPCNFKLDASYIISHCFLTTVSNLASFSKCLLSKYHFL